MKNSKTEFVWPELMKAIPCQFKTAFLSATFLGFLTHLYIITNLLLNHDSERVLFSNGSGGLPSGRWSADVLSDFSTKFQLPVVILLLSIFMIALTAGFTVMILETTSKPVIILTSAFLVTFPSVAGMFSYVFAADVYFICLFLNALAVFLAKKYSWGWLPAIILCAFALGGYQSFICYSIALFLMDCILDLFFEKEIRNILKKGIKYIGIIVAALILYYLILICILTAEGVQLLSYQGINTIGSTGLKVYISQIPKAFKNFAQFYKEFPYSTEFYQNIQVCFLLFALCALGYLAVAYKFHRQNLRLLLLILGCIMIPLALNFITVLAPNASVHALMIYSFVLLNAFSLKIIELASKKMMENHISGWAFLYLCNTLLVGLLIWNYFCVDNIAYLRLQVCYENSFALANRIVSRIEVLDEYSLELPVAIIGEASLKLYGGTVNEFSQINALTGTADRLLYSPDPHIRTRTFIEHYIGFHMPTASQSQKDMLSNSEVVRALPSYPKEGSIMIYDGIIVVKLSDGPVR